MAMKENSVITVREALHQAKTGDRGCLITRYSMSTCCLKGAKAGTKDLNFKTCSKVVSCLKETLRCLLRRVYFEKYCKYRHFMFYICMLYRNAVGVFN